MKKRWSFAIILAVMMLLLCGCDTTSYEEIYNDDARIAEETDDAFYVNLISSGLDDTHGIAFKEFSGKDTMFKMIVTEEPASMKLSYNVMINEGEFKIVQVSPNGAIDTIYEGKEAEGVAELELEAGDSRVCIVGAKAKGNARFDVLSADDGITYINIRADKDRQSD